MPSSDYISIPKVLQVVERLHPRSILDIGVGNGRYGFLFREVLDWNYGRLAPQYWSVQIDGVEVDASYINHVHHYVYDHINVGDWLQLATGDAHYDLCFLGDVLEHWGEGDWQLALSKARDVANVTLVVCPNHAGSMRQGAWCGHEAERHLSLLSPEILGGRCLFANSKMFMVGFDNLGIGILEHKDVCQ